MNSSMKAVSRGIPMVRFSTTVSSTPVSKAPDLVYSVMLLWGLRRFLEADKSDGCTSLDILDIHSVGCKSFQITFFVLLYVGGRLQGAYYYFWFRLKCARNMPIFLQ